MMTVVATSRTGMATLRTELTLPPVAAERTSPATAMSGAMTPMRRSMVRNSWTLVTSDVERVTSDAVPNRSTSAAESSCTL